MLGRRLAFRRRPPAIPSSLVAAALAIFLAATGSGAAAPPKDELAAAVREADVARYLEALGALLEDDALEKSPGQSIRKVLGAYSRLAKSLADKQRGDDFHELHGKTASALGRVTVEPARKELDTQRRRSNDWRVRLLLLDAASFHRKPGIESAALEALRDASPIVVRRALKYLGSDRKVSVVEAIVGRLVELDARKPSGSDAAQWDRTLFAFYSTLRRLVGIDLTAAADWKSYVEQRKGSPDFFRPRNASEASRTAVSLFGAAVTGKHIVFVLDISGSMTSSDPAPEGDGAPPRRRRTVASEAERRAEELKQLEERRRITRAKRELTRVIQSLPPDIRFNIVAYSTEVSSWRRSAVTAGADNKKAACQFVEGLEAQGITHTDDALEAAFSDLDVDTIYLITDGAPTHIGSTAPGLPEDARELMEAIHERLEVLNFLRDVRIFTLGFPEAEEDFLEKIAADHAGAYVPIR